VQIADPFVVVFVAIPVQELFVVSTTGTVGPLVLLDGLGVQVQSDGPTALSVADPLGACVPSVWSLSCIIVKGSPIMPKRKKQSAASPNAPKESVVQLIQTVRRQQWGACSFLTRQTVTLPNNQPLPHPEIQFLGHTMVEGLCIDDAASQS
jgi:hypothetical protein